MAALATAAFISIIQVGCSTSAPTAETPVIAAAAARAAETVALGEPIAFDATGGQVDAGDATGGVLTLPEAARRALTTHPDIQAALSRVRAAQADVDQARLFPNPILNVSLRPAFEGKSIIEAGLSADLVALLTRPGRISAADNRLRAVSADALSVALDVLADVQQRYAAAQALDELMTVLAERRQLLDRLLSLAQSRLAGGEGTRLDVVTLQAQRVQLEVEITDQRLARLQERLALARLIGQPSGATDWQLTRWEPPQHPKLAESAWVAAALEGRPEIQARRYELAALGIEVRLAPLGFLQGYGVGVNAERDDSWRVGPGLTTPLPIFDWGQARRDRAFAQVIEARHQLTRTRRLIIEDVRRAHQTFTASWAALEQVRGELIPLAEQRRAQAEAQFRAGQTDITALVLAEQDLQAARARLVELQRRASAAVIGLERSVGGPRVVDRASGAAPPDAAPASPPATQPTTGGGPAARAVVAAPGRRVNQ